MQIHTWLGWFWTRYDFYWSYFKGLLQGVKSQVFTSLFRVSSSKTVWVISPSLIISRVKTLELSILNEDLFFLYLKWNPAFWGTRYTKIYPSNNWYRTLIGNPSSIFGNFVVDIPIVVSQRSFKTKLLVSENLSPLYCLLLVQSNPVAFYFVFIYDHPVYCILSL